MKLIDILARELDIWPGESSLSDYCVQADDTTEVFFGSRAKSFLASELADDRKTCHVTRAEWQAAVDALKAPKVVEWNGEGLPPVGTVCEVLNSNLGNPEWERCTILYSGKHRIVYDSESCEERTAFIDSLSFRPIRTPEQIAAEECDKAVKAMLAEFAHTGSLTSHYEVCEVLHKAGYRKFEIIEEPQS